MEQYFQQIPQDTITNLKFSQYTSKVYIGKFIGIIYNINELKEKYHVTILKMQKNYFIKSNIDP